MDLEKLQSAAISSIETHEPSEVTLSNFKEARMNVVLGSYIFAYTMMHCEFLFSNDIPTAAAAIDGNRNIVFFNEDFFNNELKNKRQRAFVLTHELDHIFFNHRQRCLENGYNHQLYNVAADYHINLRTAGKYLTDDGTIETCHRYSMNFEMPSIGLYDEKYMGMSSDQIYHILLEEGDGDAKKALESLGLGGVEGSGLDVLLGDGGSESRKQENLKVMMTAVVSAQQANAVGVSEGGMVKSVYEMTKPKISWTDRLLAAATARVRERPTYKRLSNLSCTHGDGVVFPVMEGRKINIVFGVDSSGSMCEDDYRTALGELSGLFEQYDHWTIRLLSCDTKAHLIGKYVSEDGDDFTDVKFDMVGLGGTNLTPLAEYAGQLYESGEMVDACIILTDGEFDSRGLDSAFHEDIINIVATTRNNQLGFENAEQIIINS